MGPLYKVEPRCGVSRGKLVYPLPVLVKGNCFLLTGSNKKDTQTTKKKIKTTTGRVASVSATTVVVTIGTKTMDP